MTHLKLEMPTFVMNLIYVANLFSAVVGGVTPHNKSERRIAKNNFICFWPV